MVINVRSTDELDKVMELMHTNAKVLLLPGDMMASLGVANLHGNHVYRGTPVLLDNTVRYGRVVLLSTGSLGVEASTLAS